LADKLAEIWQATSPGPDLEMERHAQEAMPQRMKQFTDTFIAIAQESV